MLGPNPSFIFATGLLGGLIYDKIQNGVKREDAQGYWVEWLAWTILLATYWGTASVKKLTQLGHTLDLEESISIDEKPRVPKRDGLVTSLVSFGMVGGPYLSQSENGKYNWELPIVTTVVILYLLINGSTSVASTKSLSSLKFLPGSSRQSSIAVAIISSISCLISVLLINYCKPTKAGPVGVRELCFLILQCIIYGALTHLTSESSKLNQTTSNVRKGRILRHISAQSFTIWTIFLAIFHGQRLKIQASLFVLGSLKALGYFILFNLSLYFSQLTIASATTLPTIIMAIGQSMRASSSSSGMAQWLSALVALGHGIYALPSWAKHRSSLLIILILPLVTTVRQNPSVSSWESRLAQTLRQPSSHAIETLVSQGQEKFSLLLSSQSNTVKKATAEYVRRYRRHPPPNFDKWFELAMANDYVLPDEFDTVMETLEPFWGLPAKELRDRVDTSFENARLIRFNISNGLAFFDHHEGAPWIAHQILTWLPPERRIILPNMTFAVNTLDEPRILSPFDALGRAWNERLSNETLDSAGEREEVPFLSVGQQKAWQALALACGINSPARKTRIEKMPRSALEFVSNVTEKLDVCLQPNLHNIHGALISPYSLDMSHALIPVFSQAKPSVFNDVLYPSPFYAGRMEGHEYVEGEDPDWAHKADIAYWAGSSTGGHATIDNWRRLHRQRLILALNSQPSDPITLLNETSPGNWDPYTTQRSELHSLFSVKITGVGQCEADACQAQEEAFKITPHGDEANPNMDPMSMAYRAKYLLDLDGNGFSGRYYRLLKSKSAVIKQTIFKEWHDGLLVPWVHFIPLSVEGDELWEMMRFLVQDKRGQVLGERIARESRSWANITLRKIDLEMAFLRLLLEYGRLMSDDRDTLNYVP